MGNLVPLYTSLTGRIGRKTWWLASIGLGIVILIIEFVILAPLGFSPMANMGAALQGGDANVLLDGIRKSQWITLVVYIVFGLPVIALGLKRRHDRDNSGLDFIIFYGLYLLIDLVGALRLGYTTMDIGNGTMIPVPSTPLTVVNVLIGIYGVYLLVVMGFLKGTTGTNQYGPDPLLAGAPVAA